MAELMLRIGSPIKVTNRGMIVISTCYYLGNGFIIESFHPNILRDPEPRISHLSEYGNEYLRIYPYEGMDVSTFCGNTTQPRYRNCVGDYLSGDDFLFSNLRDFDLIDDCHLNEFEWFGKIKKIVAEKLARMKNFL